MSEKRRSRCYSEGPKRAVVVATHLPLAAVVPTVAAAVFASLFPSCSPLAAVVPTVAAAVFASLFPSCSLRPPRC